MARKIVLPAKDGTEITTYHWAQSDQSRTRAVIQIAHGMAEHILRYDDFCNFLTGNGFMVYGNNHRGHGKSAEIQGYFAESDGFNKVVDDMHQVTKHIGEAHPHIPIYLIGHSMGSFLTRRYIQLYGEEIDGVILTGTGGDQGLIGKIGLQIAKSEVRKLGAKTPSPRMDKLIFGSYNKQFKPSRTSFDFLTRDEAIVDAYIADEDCGFICSSGFYVDLISGIELIHKTTEIKRTPSHLPIYFLAGDMDPVGNNGKGVDKTYQTYKKLGFTNVNMKLYKDARHEILNETNRQEVYDDILIWLDKQLDGGNVDEED